MLKAYKNTCLKPKRKKKKKKKKKTNKRKKIGREERTEKGEGRLNDARFQSSHHGSAETNPTSIHEDAGLIPGFAWWVKNPMLL